MKAVRWLLGVVALVALCGCEPTEVNCVLRSPRRLDQEVVAVVPPERVEMVKATVEALFGPGWRLHEGHRDGEIRVRLHRTVDPHDLAGASVERRVSGPLRLRYDYRLKLDNPVAKLKADDPLRQALASQSSDLVIRVRVAGQVTAWKIKLGEAADPAKLPAVLEVHAQHWRAGLLGLYLVLLAAVIWVIWPAFAPDAETRARRAASRIDQQQQRSAKVAAKAQRRQEREAAAAAKAAAKAAAQPAPSEAPAPVAEKPSRWRRKAAAPPADEPTTEESPAAAAPATLVARAQQALTRRRRAYGSMARGRRR